MWKPVKDQKRSLQVCTVEELLGLYIEEVPGNSLAKSPQLIKDFLREFSMFKPTQIDELAMRCFYQRQKLEYDYTSHSLSTRKYQIQGFFKWMTSRGVIEDSPQSKITMGRSKVYKRKKIWVKPHKIEEAVEGAKRNSPGFLYPILLLIHETAAKTSDIIELKWEDVDLKEKKVIFREGEKIQNRILPISNEMTEAFKSIDQISQHVFTNLEGRPLYKHCLVRELRILKRKLGIIQDWVFRDLRYSYAVNFLKAGGELKELQVTMGHWHVQLTKELYGRFYGSKADFFDIEAVPETGVAASGNSKF